MGWLRAMVLAMGLWACAERPSSEAPMLPAPPAPSATPTSPPPPPPAPSSRPMTSSPDELTIKTSGYTGVLGRGSVHGVTIEVTDNTEKREMDGNSMMRVRLHVRANDKEGDVHLTSHENEKRVTWEGYTFEYRGGWRDEVMLKVTQTR